MSLSNVVSVLSAKRIWLWDENGALRFAAPKGAMDPDTRTLIGAYRDSLRELVRRYSPCRCLIAPATISQSSLIFIQNLASYTAAYNIAVSFRLCAPLARSAFESACTMLCRRHTQLRASFLTVHDDQTGDQMICQIIKDGGASDIRYNDGEISDKKAVITEYKRQFDLEAGPLIRWTVFNAASASPVVLMTMHHSIVDAWSVRIIVQDFFTGYGKRISKPDAEENDLSDPSFGYIDFALHQQELFTKEYFKEHRRFFRAGLQHCMQPIDLHTDFPRPEVAELRGDSIPFVISSDLYKKISVVARQNGVTVNSVLLTAYMLLIHNETGQERFAVGMPASNRTIPSFLEVVGYFINTLAVPFRSDGVSTYGELMKAVHAAAMESLKYQEFPFPSVVDLLNPPRDTSRAPVFQVLFNFLSRSFLGAAADLVYEGLPDDIPRSIEGIEVRPFPIPQQEGQYDLTLEIIERDGFASGQLKYAIGLFAQPGAQRLVRQYLVTLNGLVDNPSGLVAQIKASEKPKKTRLAVAATFTADLIADCLDFWIDRLGLECVPEFAPYGQVMQQLLDPTSLFRTNDNGYNVILLRLDDLRYTSGNSGTLPEILSTRCDEILSAVAAAASSQHAAFFVFFCPSSPGLTEDPATRAMVDGIQSRYTGLFNELPGVYATAADIVLSWYPVGNFHDPLRLENGHIPYTDAFFTALSTAILRRIFVIRQKPVKVIAIDCDNTLWSGVAAEDGPKGVTVGDPYRQFQKLLSRQPDAGRLLTLVSKNREEDVDAVFSENGSMLLTKAAIHSRRINWTAKSENIRSLADEINVGLDGFLFIDDNPVECAEVSGALPQALVVKFPAAPPEIPAFLSGLWMLDNPKTTEEDRRRSEFYRVEKQRSVIRAQTASLADFLEKLDLQVTFEELNDRNGERLSQLTYRTNQFNFSGGKCSYQELCGLRSSGYDIRAVSVKDRFGDYGIVGMTACRFENDSAVVETLLLSCRVLGRGVEHRMVRKLAEIASGKSVSGLQLRYKATDRNRPAMDFIESIRSQCPSAKQENGSVFIALADIPLLSAVSATEERSAAEPPRPSDQGPAVADQPPQDIMARNRRYCDIVENLSSLDRIRAAVEQHLQRKQTRFEAPVKSAPGASPLETEIAEIWKKTLRVSAVDTSINFFDLGGKSLQLPQVMADLETAFGVRLVLVDLFKFTTVRALAEYIQGLISHEKNGKITISDSINKRLSGMQAMRQRQQQSRSRLNT